MTKKIKWNWKSILSIIVVIALLMGTLALVIGLTSGNNRTKIKSGAFSRGSLDSNGKYVDTKQSIYTKEAFGALGLRVEPDFEFVGTYDVFYYDYNDKFLESKTQLTGIYDEDYPLAMMARIVIHPAIPSDENSKEFKIGWLEVGSYVNQFDITVNSIQNWKYSTENLYIDENALYDHNFNMGPNKNDVQNDVGDNYMDLTEWSGVKVSEKIDLVDGCTRYDVFYRVNQRLDTHTFSIVASADGIILESIVKNILDVEAGKWMKVTLVLPDDSTADHLRLRMPNCTDCYVFGYN